MSVVVSFNDKKILKCKNVIMQVLYENIMKIIESENATPSSSVLKLLDQMNQEKYGGGAISPDIYDFIKNKSDFIIFTNLVEKALNRWIEETPDLPESYKDWMWDFHKELKAIAGTFPGCVKEI